MPRYGCPECGSCNAGVRCIEHRWTSGHFDPDGSYIETDSYLEDGDYEDYFECIDCGYGFGEPVITCIRCERPKDKCECENCGNCGHMINECKCGCYTPEHKDAKSVKHVNPMANFVSDMSKTY